MTLHRESNKSRNQSLHKFNHSLRRFAKEHFKVKRIAAVLLMLSLLLPMTFVPASAQEREMNERIAAGDYRNLPTMTAMILAVDQFISKLFGGEENELNDKRKAANDSAETSSNRPSPSELAARVRSVKLNPSGETSVQRGQTFTLSAIPLDAKGNAVHGLSVKWQSSDEKIVRVSEDGRAKALQVGNAQLSATVGRVSASVKVKVETESSAAIRTKLLLQQQQLDYESLFTPQNSIGTPYGKTEQGASVPSPAVPTREKPGSASFGFGVPLVGLNGRGLGISLGLNYNSRVWNKSSALGDTVLNFDVDKSWISPGFNLGYGALDIHLPSYVGQYAGVLISPNGTRHRLRVPNTIITNYFNVESDDGSFVQGIIYRNSSAPYNLQSGKITYTNGTTVYYDLVAAPASYSNRLFPTKITDRHGNYIQISYVSGTQTGEIDFIRDTMNRYVRFKYEGAGAARKLVTITVPAFNDTINSEKQVARFYYADKGLSHKNKFANKAANSYFSEFF
jgi:hypothetical protein